MSGSVTYSGSFATSPGVNGTHPIGIEVYTNNTFTAGDNGVSIAGAATVTSNGGSFAITLTTPGTYYVLVNYDAPGVTGQLGLVDQGGPFASEPYAFIYGTGNTTSNFPASAGVTLPSGTTNLNTINFGDSNVAQGAEGAVTFTDNLSLGRTVSSTNRIHVLAYLTGSNYGTLMTASTAKSSPGKYNVSYLGNTYNSYAFDLVAFYDVAGNKTTFATPVAGTDPVTYINAVPIATVSIGTPTIQAINLNDGINGYTAPMTLSASTTFTVNSTNQLGWLVASSFGGGNSYQVLNAVNSAAGSVVFNDTTPQNYYVGLLYGATGAGYATGENPLAADPHVGDIYQFFNFSGNNSNGEGCFGTYGSANVANPAGGVSLHTAFPYASTQPCTFTGIGGNISTTAGTVNSGQQLVVAEFSDSGYTASLNNNRTYPANNSRYDILDFSTPSTYYVEAWYQETNNSCNDGKSPCIGDAVTQLGAFTQGTANPVNISINGSTLYQGISVSGILTWTGATSVYIATYDNNGNFLTLSSAVASGGTYTAYIEPSATNVSYLVAVNDTGSYGAANIKTALLGYNTSSLTGDGWAVYSNTSCGGGFNNPTIEGGNGLLYTTSQNGLNWTVTTSCTF